jgi:hypothetical protein
LDAQRDALLAAQLHGLHLTLDLDQVRDRVDYQHRDNLRLSLDLQGCRNVPVL